MTRGVPKKLTEKQIKFAKALVFNETRLTPRECAIEAGTTQNLHMLELVNYVIQNYIH
jgi:hypothetical protein